jgi:hypothetical protein
MNDTSPQTEKILVEGYRAMAPEKKLRQVSQMTLAVQEMALMRLRSRYGEMDEREQKLRLASLWLPRETMIRLFGWDPQEKGY